MAAPVVARVALAALLLQGGVTPQQQARTAWVPNPRVADGTWVSDAAHHLRPATVDSINAMIAALERATGAEIAVVVVDSLAGLTEQEFALAIHRAWGVGKRDADNGLVLLWAPRDRAVFISVGYGLEGAIPDRRAGRIRDEVILSAFRAGDFDRGMLAGVSALAAAIRSEAATGAATRVRAPAEPHSPFLFVLGALGAVVGTVGGGIGGVVGVRRWRRRRPRTCANGHAMRLLDEAADDSALDAGQRKEEELKSVDWDVWVCDTCGEVTRVPYRRLFTRITDCPKCQRRTLQTAVKTLVPATTAHGGRELVSARCRNCDYALTSERATPRLSSSSSSGGSSSGGGGGSSFGGGSAGGGGAGGHY
jgi:uncharacterized protein